jgi:hypothetical protein
VFLLSVPTIDSVDALRENLENPYHINNLTPAAWLAKMRRFFAHAQGYRHWLEPEWLTPTGDQDYSRKPEARNYTFTERDDAEMMSGLRTMGTVVVARGPRLDPLPNSPIESNYPPEWGVVIDPVTGLPGRLGPSTGVLGPIHGDRAIEQEFTAPAEGISGLRVLMATFARVNDSELVLTLREGSGGGRIVARRELRACHLIDNGWLEFRLEPRADLAGRRLLLSLAAPAGRPDNAVTAYYRSDVAAGDGALSVGGRARPGNVLWYEMIP